MHKLSFIARIKEEDAARRQKEAQRDARRAIKEAQRQEMLHDAALLWDQLLQVGHLHTYELVHSLPTHLT